MQKKKKKKSGCRVERSRWSSHWAVHCLRRLVDGEMTRAAWVIPNIVGQRQVCYLRG